MTFASDIPSPAQAARRTAGRAALRAALAFVLVACLALWDGPSPSRAYAAYPSESQCDTSWYDDSASTFTLTSAAQLAGLAYLVSVEHVTFAGKTVLLGRDIDLSGICKGDVNWRPIGTEYTGGESFQGTFDGQGHKVSNLRTMNGGYYEALFGKVKHARIQNLTVSGMVQGIGCVAGIVAYCDDSDLSNLTNECTVDALSCNEDTKHEGSAAGVVCYVASAYPTGDRVFQNLVNRGKVLATSYYSAGVVGFLFNDDGYSTTLSQCANYGDVSVAAARYGLDGADRAVGGVLGSTAGAYGTYHLVDCLNEGDVSSANCISTGGVAGYLGGNGSTVTSSSNGGAVSGAQNAGGIVGFLGAASGQVKNTLNRGQVSGDAWGGVVGSASRNAQSYANNYSLKSAASSAYGSGAGGRNAGAVLSAAKMKKQSFLDQLNDGSQSYSIVATEAGGLPVLAWAHPGVKPGSGGEADNPYEDAEEGDEPDDASGEPVGGDQTEPGSQDGAGDGTGGSGTGKADYANGVGGQGPVSASDIGADDPTAPTAATGGWQQTDAQEASTLATEPAAAASAAAGAPSQESDDANFDVLGQGEAVPDADVQEWSEIEMDQPEQPDQPDEPQQEVEEAQEQQPERTMQMVEVSALPEQRAPEADLERDIPLAVRIALGAVAALCVAAGFAFETRSFTRSCSPLAPEGAAA